jgi:hypothetical protein
MKGFGCLPVLISHNWQKTRKSLLSKVTEINVLSMTTRMQMRTTIREYLEDTTGTPLWSDAALNEYLVAAMRAYGVTFPRQATAATDPIAAGATSVPLPAGLLATGIVAVRDAHGRDVPRASQRPGPASIDATGLIQAWSVWAGTLRLQRPASGDEVGAWVIDHLAGRELIADDVSQQPIESGDEPIVVALAATQAMKRRLVEDAKRGAPLAGSAEAVATFTAEAERLIAGRKRRVRGGFGTLA